MQTKIIPVLSMAVKNRCVGFMASTGKMVSR